MAEAAGKGIEDAVRDIRDRLMIELERLDALGEFVAAIELDTAIRILNRRLGDEPGSDALPLPG
ncbi:hypothetical protein [Sphingopyxis sp. NJF-3]